MNLIECWVVKVLGVRCEPLMNGEELVKWLWIVDVIVEDESGCKPYKDKLCFDTEAEAHFVSKGYTWLG